MWIAHNATITTIGHAAWPRPGHRRVTLSYDYEQKMEKHEFKTAEAGKTVVFRWDKKDPGEPWSRAFEWTLGKEALCCYIDLCTASDVLDQHGRAPAEVELAPSAGLGRPPREFER